MMKIITVLFLIPMFSFCSVDYIKSPCPLFKFYKIEELEAQHIRVHKDDIVKYKDYILALKEGIKFCNKQFEVYNKLQKEK